MDEGAPAPVGSRPLTRPENADGLAEEVAAVEAARNQLGRDLDRLNYEVRNQIGRSVEKFAWQAGGTGAAIASGIIMRKLLTALWKSFKKSDPPVNPASRQTAWPDAIAWTIASGVAYSIGRLVARRGAAAGWEKVTGHLPPGLEDVS